jgi:sugar lactone lactonase YvrE
MARLLVSTSLALALLATTAAFGGPEDERSADCVVDGLEFTEGPVWHPEGYLVFSDIPADTIYRLTDEGAQQFRRPSGKSNGLAYDREGRLLACEHGNRRVSRTEADGTVVALATHYEGKQLNSPNDLCLHSDGSIYFTDPPYGLEGRKQELHFAGVFRIAPDGSLRVLATDFRKPNGIALSPDERTIYVADTERQLVMAYDVSADGGIENPREFVRLETPNRWSGPDGMKVDVEGNLYVTSPGGVWVYTPAGKLVTVIALPQTPTNCGFGGSDGRTLYVTAGGGVYAVGVEHQGLDYCRRFPETAVAAEEGEPAETPMHQD